MMPLPDSVYSSQLPQPELAPEIIKALVFERSKRAIGSVHIDPFYTLALKTTSDSSLPGTFLKVQESIDSTLYSTPSSVSISRLIYQSLTLTGDPIPVSAYIIWPLLPRRNSDGSSQIVAWANGTSGIFSECAPSHLRNLHQHFLAPYALVLFGYVIVATDYADLGVSHCSQPQNQLIIHHYLANPAAANDVIYSIVAARSAFPSLGSKSVSIGHSQGGGAFWAIAQHNSKENMEGYLGGVAIILTTDIRSNFDPIGAVVWAGMMVGLKNVFPKFQYPAVFTEEGLAAVNTYREVEGGGAVGMGLFLPLALEGILLRHGWRENEWVIKYNDLIMSGGKGIGGTLLVIHGEKDPLIDFTLTEKAVHDIAMKYPDSELEFIRLPTTHDSAITESQWYGWSGLERDSRAKR
ncbi:uncharacterized protein EAF02_008609 [Botrytis sinoallii]|uniref:uncharacterized protein n=1 Tax=Botrytis sinoallii TaxID=1463999 RepID=UPI0019002446|nr:uncharacterized protein EAF02_008609 [Botrytis sinoallii]KAF7874632.1 hypothetical protein EAF02_008609 [Botrytis sinoallii]